MGNTLVNSMVRGFGLTLGRKAANAVTAPSQPKVSQIDLKRQSLINEHEVGLDKFKNILETAKASYQSSKITKREYEILESQCLKGIREQEEYITKLQGAETKKGGSGLLVFFGIIFVIYALLWIGKVI
jgi:hypothetical protein